MSQLIFLKMKKLTFLSILILTISTTSCELLDKWDKEMKANRTELQFNGKSYIVQYKDCEYNGNLEIKLFFSDGVEEHYDEKSFIFYIDRDNMPNDANLADYLSEENHDDFWWYSAIDRDNYISGSAIIHFNVERPKDLDPEFDNFPVIKVDFNNFSIKDNEGNTHTIKGSTYGYDIR